MRLLPQRVNSRHGPARGPRPHPRSEELAEGEVLLEGVPLIDAHQRHGFPHTFYKRHTSLYARGDGHRTLSKQRTRPVRDREGHRIQNTQTMAHEPVMSYVGEKEEE